MFRVYGVNLHAEATQCVRKRVSKEIEVFKEPQNT